MRKLLVLTLVLAALLGAEEKKRAPREVRRQAEITLRVVEASSAATGSNDGAYLVPQELQTLLRFSRYHLLDTAMIRGAEGEQLRLAIAGDLLAEVRFGLRGTPQMPVMEYEVEIEGQKTEKGSGAKLLDTTATGKSGETVVLGASRMKDARNALIVLLNGKLLP